MAIAERHLAAEFGDEIVDHHTYVLASDGDLMEGISQEAIALAGHLRLNKLIVLFDDNGITIDGALSLSDSVDQVKRFEAAGWAARRIDGHDPDAIAAAIEQARDSDRPSLIACRTTIALRRADQGGQARSRTARRSARTRSRARARSSAGTSRPSRFRPTCARCGARPGQRGQAARKRLERAPCGAPGGPARRIRAAHARATSRAGSLPRRCAP